MSNPDKDFPNDPDRFTPMEMPVVLIPKYPPEDSLDLLDGEETGVPFGLEQEAYGTPKTWAQQVEAESAAAGHEEKPSLLFWPPLNQEQVVELHKALVAFVAEMAAARRPMSDDDQQTVIWCAATGLHGILERLNIGTPQPPPRQEENLGGFACLDERRMGPAVKHNCWTCANNQPPRNNCPINGRLDVAMWVGSTHGWTMDGMPPKDCDGCPGWMPRS